MNYSRAVLIVNDKIKVVAGKYEETQKETLFKTLDPTLKVGDFCVVESNTRWGITTVKITKVDAESDVDFDAPETMNWVVSKINMSDHQAIKDLETQAITAIKAGELRKRREDIIKNTLDAAAAGELGEKFAQQVARLQGPTLEAPKTPGT